MGIFSTVKNFIKTEVLGVTDDTQVKPAQKSTKSAKPNAVVECKNVGKNEDTVVINNKNKKQAANKAQKRSVGQIRESIKQKCQANNINFAEVLKNIPQVAGLTREKFNALPENLKEEVMLFLEKELDRTIALQKKHGHSDKTNTAEVVTESAKNKYEAKKAGVNVNAVEEEAGDVNAELGKDFRKLSRKEKRARFKQMIKARKEAFEHRLQERLAKISPRYRAKMEAKLRAEHEYAENARFNEVLATNDSDTALEAVVMLPAEKMATGIKTVLNTRCDKTEKTATADKAKFEYTEGLMKDYYERGEKPSGEVVQEYTQTVVAAKSAQAVVEYQNDYKTKRDAYESGEETPAYLDKDFFTSSAKGIGEGALENTNMTNDKKAQFISDWNDDAKKYDDYEIVTRNVNEQLETKSEYKEISDKVKVINEEKAQTKVKTANKTVENEVTQKTPAEETYKAQTVTPEPVIQTTSNIKIDNNSKQKTVINEKITKISNPVPKQTNNSILIAKEIRTTSIDDAIKKFGHSTVIETVLDNPNLKHMRPQLATIIKGYDLNSLKKLAQSCSTSSFVYICSIVNKEFVEELKDERKDLCYSARKQVENMEKQNA